MVAALMIEGTGPPMVAIYDSASGRLSMPGPMAVPRGQSAQLWAIVGDDAPHPLGRSTGRATGSRPTRRRLTPMPAGDEVRHLDRADGRVADRRCRPARWWPARRSSAPDFPDRCIRGAAADVTPATAPSGWKREHIMPLRRLILATATLTVVMTAPLAAKNPMVGGAAMYSNKNDRRQCGQFEGPHHARRRGQGRRAGRHAVGDGPVHGLRADQHGLRAAPRRHRRDPGQAREQGAR